MKNRLKSILKKILFPTRDLLVTIYYHFRHYVLQVIGGEKDLDFELDTLPKIDRDDVSIDEIIREIQCTYKLPYDLKEKLYFFKKNGYVVLENALPIEEVDAVWNDIEYTFQHNEEFDIEALVHRFNDQKDTPIKLVPKEKLNSMGSRLIDFHDSSVKTKQLLSHKHLVPFIQAILTPQVTVFQSLVFKYSSQQMVHQDFPWVTTEIPSHLAAAWIPLEDVHPDSGPLFYYPGTHRMKKFNFGRTGVVYKKGLSINTPEQFATYIEKKCNEANFKKEILLIKKGDVLFWHGALAHGGCPINDPNKTRKSLVVHYSTTQGYTKHRNAVEKEKNPDLYNGITIYTNPKLAHQKDYLK